MINEVLDAIRTRRSIRKFQTTPINHEKLNTILEAGRWAPSFANTQPWRFIVIDNDELKKKLAVATAHESVKQAPVSIAIAVDTKTDTIHYVETGAAATQNMALAAHSLGIGTFWIGVANTASEPKIRKILGLSPSHRVVSILPIGYPAESPIEERKELSELVTSQRSKRS